MDCSVPKPYSRKIASGLKSHKIVEETEHPIRWPFMKVLRETSSLKRFYPEIDPYAEAYLFRDNIWCIFSESMDGAGDPWSYLIVGPERCLLIDTGFGVGDLRGLCIYLAEGKPIVVANTHAHVDHALGDFQFEEVWCHVAERERLERLLVPSARDYLFDGKGEPRWTWFDRADLIPFRDVGIRSFEEGHLFDLGQGYEVEAIPLPGHTPGQCGFLDRYNMALFTGDITSIGHCAPDEPYAGRCTVRAMCEAFRKLKPRFGEITGVFPGHGALDQSPLSLQYHLDALEAVLADPSGYDEEKTFVMGPLGEVTARFKYIYQGTAIRYTQDNVG